MLQASDVLLKKEYFFSTQQQLNHFGFWLSDD